MSNAESICTKCGHREDCTFMPKSKAVKKCGFYKAPPTNADRIRSMTDEELANWWAFMQVAFDFMNPLETLKWLKQEVDE